MSAVRNLLRRLLDTLGTIVSRQQVKRFRARHPGEVVVLDIDNTLADAWPSFLGPATSERRRLSGLAALPGVKAAAYHGDRPVLFLSHRAWWHWDVTWLWIRAQAMAGTVVLVASPADKLAHLRYLVDHGGPVVYWDDLSHGTERGETRLYTDVVEAVAALGLEYHGYDEIEAVVAAAGGRRMLP